MDVIASLRTALRALRKNKLRSLLAMLGIVIAVGAVVATVSIGQGAQAKVAAQMESLGSNLLMVVPGSAALGRSRTAMDDVVSGGFEGRMTSFATVMGARGTEGLAAELTEAGPEGGTSQAENLPVAKPAANAPAQSRSKPSTKPRKR